MAFSTYHLTDNEVLYYLHIPKTAGTSFNDILQANFAPDESSFGLPANEFVKLPANVVAKYKAISGHYFYNIQLFTPRTPVYITMFRDPLERTISMYTQARRLPNHYAYEIAKTQSLHEFITDPRMQGLYVNCQTRYIALDPNTIEMAKKLSPAALDNWELWRQMENFAPNGFSDPELLTRAQERLQKFAFVGLTEKFDEAVDLLCHTFGWPVPTAAKILNVSPTRLAKEEIAQETLDIIRENTQLDSALYETAQQIFNARYEQMVQESPDKIQQSINLDSNSIQSMQRQLDYQKRLIDSLQEDRAKLEAIIRAMQTSFGWRFTLRINKMRLKIIPHGSTREAIYLKLRGQ
jgi:hypothetical protein